MAKFVLFLMTYAAIFSTGCAARAARAAHRYHKPYQVENAYRIEHASWPDCKVLVKESLVRCKCSEFLMETDAQTNDVLMRCAGK